MKRKSTKTRCLVCTNKKQVRGLCGQCYAEARRAIRAAETTESELISQGLLLPTLQRGRPLQNKMRAAIAEMKTSKN